MRSKQNKTGKEKKKKVPQVQVQPAVPAAVRNFCTSVLPCSTRTGVMSSRKSLLHAAAQGLLSAKRTENRQKKEKEKLTEE
jgi:hypothetical protein